MARQESVSKSFAVKKSWATEERDLTRPRGLFANTRYSRVLFMPSLARPIGLERRSRLLPFLRPSLSSIFVAAVAAARIERASGANNDVAAAAAVGSMHAPSMRKSLHALVTTATRWPNEYGRPRASETPRGFLNARRIEGSRGGGGS